MPTNSYIFLLLLMAFLAWAIPMEIPAASSFYVPTLPGLRQDHGQPLDIYAGHIVSDPNASSASKLDVLAHLFFVMVKARRAADKERLMFWFNGGPGCSSMEGLMMEIGPWRVDRNGGLKFVGGWEEYTTIVYVDQPVGTGFSYTSTNHYVHTLEEATDHVIQFLKTFYQVFPEYLSVDTYLSGESFAGQYIPYFADAILRSDLNIPLRGAAIGSGWIDGRHQYPAYLQYAVTHGMIDVESQEYKDSQRATDQCLAKFDDAVAEPINVDECKRLASTVLGSKIRIVDGVEKCVNFYDARLEDDYPACGLNWPLDSKDIYHYFLRRDVVEALHASDKPEGWVECRGRVASELHTKLSPSSIMFLPSIIERIPVLLFVGDKDYVCNYIGIERMIDTMTWNGQKGLGSAVPLPWTVAGTPAGTWVSSRNLTYVKVSNASHMVPYDRPDVAHDMILRFMGVNFSAILEGSARMPSSVGSEAKPILTDDGNLPVSFKLPKHSKPRWDDYNSGTATLVLLFIVIGACVCIYRQSGKVEGRIQLLGERSNVREKIPLKTGSEKSDDIERAQQKRTSDRG